MTTRSIIIAVLVTASLATSGCAEEKQTTAMQAAAKNAEEAEIYIPKNDIELGNYNRRQRLADDPTTILWCTFFPFGNMDPITFAVVGKLTSGNKRPYPTEKAVTGYSETYHPELPGPDGMFGSSGEYRYGFGPDGVYHDLYGVQSYCTSQPMIYRTQPSGMRAAIVDPHLANATKQAREVLRSGLKDRTVSQEALAKADRILNEALTGSR